MFDLALLNKNPRSVELKKSFAPVEQFSAYSPGFGAEVVLNIVYVPEQNPPPLRFQPTGDGLSPLIETRLVRLMIRHIRTVIFSFDRLKTPNIIDQRSPLGY